MPGIYREYGIISPKQFKQGDYTRKQLIESYIPLVLRIARKFPKKWIEPDEARSIGLLELTRTISNCSINSQAELTNLVRRNVFNKIKDYCSKYYSRSVIRTKARGIEPVITCKLPKNLGYKHNFQLDLLDLIDNIITDPVKKFIIERIIEGGYTNTDIAEELGVSREWIRRERNRLLRELKNELCNTK